MNVMSTLNEGHAVSHLQGKADHTLLYYTKHREHQDQTAKEKQTHYLFKEHFGRIKDNY